ncbi:uncharacterized protein TNCV_5007101 [Trichonephila clavipes]|nr:uncharacterized protein TNCV_5007101 [Trichonephila clavipes]
MVFDGLEQVGLGTEHMALGVIVHCWDSGLRRQWVCSLNGLDETPLCERKLEKEAGKRKRVDLSVSSRKKKTQLFTSAENSTADPENIFLPPKENESAFQKAYKTFNLPNNDSSLGIKEFLLLRKEETIFIFRNELETYKALKVSKWVHCIYSKATDAGKMIKNVEFKTPNNEVLQEFNLARLYDDMSEKIVKESEDFEGRDSGWTLDEILRLEVRTNRYSPFRGSSSFIEVPKQIAETKAIINVINKKDSQCFMWSILAALYPNTSNPNKTSSYVPHLNKLNFDGISFPTPLNEKKKQFNSPPQLENQSQCRRKTTQLVSRNETTQQEKTTQLVSRNETTQQEKTTQLGNMNETTQQEKTTQLSSRNEQLNSAAGPRQLKLASRNETPQLVGRNETTQLCTAVDRLQPPANAYNRLQPPTTACNRLQPPATACNPARLHRLYSRIGFFYLLMSLRIGDLTPDGHGYELVSSVRALVPQKFSVEEELMHVKHVEVKSPHVGVMWKFGRGVISSGRALDWFDVFGYRVVEDKAADYAHLKQALTEQFPVVRNRSELETRFYASFQKHHQSPSDFVYVLLKIHNQLTLDMGEGKLLDHVISRLEPQLLDYVEVRHPQTTSNLLQIIDKNRQKNWRDTRVNNRYSDNSRPQRESNRLEGQGVGDNRRFDSRRRNGQSDHRFNNQGGRQGGSRNGAFRDSPEAYRFTVDYRNLNAITKYPRYPLPVIDDLITNIPHTAIMSTQDLKSGYFQLAVNPKDIEKTMFIKRNDTFAFL